MENGGEKLHMGRNREIAGWKRRREIQLWYNEISEAERKEWQDKFGLPPHGTLIKRDYYMLTKLQDLWPVMVLYGEILGNAENAPELEKFLGMNGFLKSDEPYEKGFYLGLELLGKLPEAFRDSQKMEKVVSQYADWAVSEAMDIDRGFMVEKQDYDSDDGLLTFARLINRSNRLRRAKYLFKPILKTENYLAVQDAMEVIDELANEDTFYQVYEKIALIETPEALKETVE